MTIDAWMEAIRRESAALAESAAADLSAPVLACPGWDVAELTYHAGEVQWFWASIVRERRLHPHDEAPERPAREDVVAWFRQQTQALLEALEAAEPSTEVWTWTDQHDVAWVVRRMAHEVAIHRWDAEEAVSIADPIDSVLAVDGIDEFSAFHLNNVPPGTGVVEVCGVRLPLIGSGEPVAVVSGDPSDALLALWRRKPVDHLVVDGDADAADAVLTCSDLN
jgi:uncharacterized protein (TIGR03083 family)